MTRGTFYPEVALTHAVVSRETFFANLKVVQWNRRREL